MENLRDVSVGTTEQSILSFFTAVLNQVRFCVQAYDAHEAVESVSISIELSPIFAEENSTEERYTFVLDEDLLSS